jgi:hypothetical protein
MAVEIELLARDQATKEIQSRLAQQALQITDDSKTTLGVGQ